MVAAGLRVFGAVTEETVEDAAEVLGGMPGP